MDIEKIRKDFPILNKKINGKNIIFFDNSSLSLKPKQVIDSMNEYYIYYSGNLGHGLHTLHRKTTEKCEEARQKILKFINGKKGKIIWTKNTTESINLVANGFNFKRGDKVLLTNLEHASTLVPFQKLAEKGLIDLDFVLCDKEGRFNLEDFENKIDKKTKMVSVIFTSQITGTTAPMKEIIKISHDYGAKVLSDGAEAIPHLHMDMKKLDLDFIAFSSHKMCGPAGMGCLYGKNEVIEKISPFLVGGETILDSDLNYHKFEKIPERLEGGVQNMSGIIGIGAAVEYLGNIGMKNIEKYEKKLTKNLIEGLMGIPELSLIGPKDHEKNPVACFNINGIKHHTIAIVLDKESILIKSGGHCTYQFFKFINQPKGSLRASLYFYNTKEEIDIFLERLKHIIKVLR